MAKFIDETGHVYGRLVVLNYVGYQGWQCRCQCGTLKIVRGGNLRAGLTTSCGCLRKELGTVRLASWCASHPDQLSLSRAKGGRNSKKRSLREKQLASLVSRSDSVSVSDPTHRNAVGSGLAHQAPRCTKDKPL